MFTFLHICYILLSIGRSCVRDYFDVFFYPNFTVHANARLSSGEPANYSSYYSFITLRYRNIGLNSSVDLVVEVYTLNTKRNMDTYLTRLFLVRIVCFSIFVYYCTY